MFPFGAHGQGTPKKQDSPLFRPGPRQPPQPFIRTQEFRRLIFFAVLLLTVTGLLVFVSVQPWTNPASESPAISHVEPSRGTIEESGGQGGSAPRSPIGISPRQHIEGLENVVDKTPMVQDAGYNTLLGTVERLGQQEIEKRVNRQIRPADLEKEPAQWRGEFVELQGLLIDWWTVRLDENPSGVQRAYRTLLLDQKRERGYLCDLTEKPPGEPRQALLRVAGVFLKTTKYENRKSEQIIVPWILARSAQPFTFPDPPGSRVLGIAAGIFAGVILLGLLVLHWFSQQEDLRHRIARRGIRKAPPKTGSSEGPAAR